MLSTPSIVAMLAVLSKLPVIKPGQACPQITKLCQTHPHPTPVQVALMAQRAKPPAQLSTTLAAWS